MLSNGTTAVGNKIQFVKREQHYLFIPYRYQRRVLNPFFKSVLSWETLRNRYENLCYLKPGAIHTSVLLGSWKKGRMAQAKDVMKFTR